MEVANASLLDEGTAAAEAMAMIARAVNSKVGVGVKDGVFMSFPLKNHTKDTTCMMESRDWRFVFFSILLNLEAKNQFFISDSVHPQSIDCIKTRAKYFGMELVPLMHKGKQEETNMGKQMLQFLSVA